MIPCKCVVGFEVLFKKAKIADLKHFIIEPEYASDSVAIAKERIKFLKSI